jgi:hypothetical protein
MKNVLFLLGAITVAAVASGGCLSEDDCEQIAGDFTAVHQQLEGSCSLIPPTRYSFEDKTMSTIEESDMGGRVTTEVNRLGCTLAITKTRTDNANSLRWQMVGDLDVDNPKRISGVMTRYEWANSGQIACQGLYDTTMTKVEPKVQDVSE